MNRYRHLPTYRYYLEEGHPLTLEKSVGKDLKDYKIYGNSVQNGTPTPETPVEIESVGEKTINIWNEEWENGYYNRDTGNKGNGNNYIRCVDYIPIEPNTTIYFNKPSDFLNYAVLFYDETFTKIGGTTPTTTTSKSYISPSNASYFTFYADMNVSNAVYKNNLIITKGTTAAEYEPCGYKIPVKITGKNIADLTQVQKFVDGMQALGTAYYGYMTNIIIDDNGRPRLQLYAASGYGNANYSELRKILTGPFKENTQYTLSFDFYKTFNGAFTNLYIQYTDGTTGNILTSGNYTANTTTNLTFTSAKNKTINHIGLNYNQGSTYIYLDTLQLQEGTTATEYEEYKELITNIYLKEPLRKIGDYADYIDFENQKVFRNVEVLDDTGTLTLEKSLNGVIDDVGTSIELPNIPTFKGTNIIEVDTTIEPTLQVQYYK